MSGSQNVLTASRNRKIDTLSPGTPLWDGRQLNKHDIITFWTILPTSNILIERGVKLVYLHSKFDFGLNLEVKLHSYPVSHSWKSGWSS